MYLKNEPSFCNKLASRARKPSELLGYSRSLTREQRIHIDLNAVPLSTAFFDDTGSLGRCDSCHCAVLTIGAESHWASFISRGQKAGGRALLAIVWHGSVATGSVAIFSRMAFVARTHCPTGCATLASGTRLTDSFSITTIGATAKSFLVYRITSAHSANVNPSRFARESRALRVAILIHTSAPAIVAMSHDDFKILPLQKTQSMPNESTGYRDSTSRAKRTSCSSMRICLSVLQPSLLRAKPPGTLGPRAPCSRARLRGPGPGRKNRDFSSREVPTCHERACSTLCSPPHIATRVGVLQIMEAIRPVRRSIENVAIHTAVAVVESRERDQAI